MEGKIWPQEGENGGKRQNIVDDISSTYTKRGVAEKENKKMVQFILLTPVMHLL